MSERKLSSTNFQNQSFLEEKCALNELLYLLSKRWMTEVLFSIEEGNTRFTSLKENLEYISDHILADRLKCLEQQELVHKSYAGGNPPRIEYGLTKSGTELSLLLGELCDFAEKKTKLT
jgi:DNA-binding HxlR family transcriptional regulator